MKKRTRNITEHSDKVLLDTDMRVLIVEDEIRLARNIAKVLDEEYSWAVDISTDGEDGRHMAMTNPYDLIILDLALPKLNGLEILGGLRKNEIAVPVLILTAHDATSDVIQGLEAGSDDYMIKPFDMGELLARCKALVRRSYGRAASVIEIGLVNINTAKHQVMIGDKPVRLSAMEYRLLEYLAMRAGEVVSKTDIVEHLYDFGSENCPSDSSFTEVACDLGGRHNSRGGNHHDLCGGACRVRGISFGHC